MCRHLAYLGPPVSLARLVLTPAHGLYEQSWAPRRQTHGVVNADGFGLGWYPAGPEAGEEPARYRRAVPIWTDQNLPELAKAVRSHAVLAAVRSATAGTGQEETAAAPFRDGRFLFSHNGAVPDWTRLPTDLACAGGSLDTPRRGIVPRGGSARRRIRPNIIRIAQPLVRRIFWVSPIMPTICMPAGL